MELIERIKQIIDYEQLSVSGFEKKISASDGVIRRAIRNNSDIYSRFLVEISDKFPDISAEWLLRESGEMLRASEASSAAPETANSNVTTLINILNNTLAEKDKQIDRLLSIIEKNNLNK